MRFTSILVFSLVQKNPRVIDFIKDLVSLRNLVLGLLSISVIGTLFLAPVQAQVPTILDAKLLADSGLFHRDMQEIRSAHQMLTKVIQNNSNSEQAYYYLGYVEYQLAILYMNDPVRGNDISAGQDSSLMFLNNAIDHLKKSISLDKKSQNAAEAHALLSMTYGQKIRIQPGKGMILGIRSRRSIKKAKKIDSDNPRIVLSEAISHYNTPSQFGGSQEKGLAGFKRAVSLFMSEDDRPQHLPTWGKVEALTWLGIAYMQTEQYQHAQDSFEKALAINPNYGWVKYSLMPLLNSKISTDT